MCAGGWIASIALPDGSYELIDYKTGHAKTAAELRDDIQLSLYAIAAREAWQLESSRQAYYYLLDDRKVPVPRAEDGEEWVREAVLAGRRGDPGAGLRADPLAGRVRALRLPHRVPGGGALSAFCQNEHVPTREQILQGPGGGNRPRAAPLDRGARDGALGGDRRRTGGGRDGVADNRWLPDSRPLPDLGGTGGGGAGGRGARATSSSTCSATRRKRRCSRSWGAEPPAGRAGAGLERHLRGLRQGRRGQVDADSEPGGGAERGRQARGRPGRRCVGLLDPAHVRLGRDAPAGLRAAQDRTAGGTRREGDVDRVLRRGGRGGGVARTDAAQGADAVPAGRGMGGARLPADRPAAGHGGRLDDARAVAAAGAVRDRDDPAAGGAESGAPGRRRWRTRSRWRSWA